MPPNTMTGMIRAQMAFTKLLPTLCREKGTLFFWP